MLGEVDLGRERELERRGVVRPGEVEDVLHGQQDELDKKDRLRRAMGRLILQRGSMEEMESEAY